jgi:hypothetical protein
MQNKKYLWVGLAVLIVAVFAVSAVIRDWSTSSGMPDHPGFNNGSIGSYPDSDTFSDNTQGGFENNPSDRFISNTADGYSFTMPPNWYLEKSGNGTFTVYPDYDPDAASSSGSPDCKIEVSTLAGPGGSEKITPEVLNPWITQYLHADPTAVISETSRRNFQIGSVQAVEWNGVLNGVKTTLAYIPAGGVALGKIIEVAPSSLSGASDADGDCSLDFQAFLANLQIET